MMGGNFVAIHRWRLWMCLVGHPWPMWLFMIMFRLAWHWKEWDETGHCPVMFTWWQSFSSFLCTNARSVARKYGYENAVAYFRAWYWWGHLLTYMTRYFFGPYQVLMAGTEFFLIYSYFQTNQHNNHGNYSAKYLHFSGSWMQDYLNRYS